MEEDPKPTMRRDGTAENAVTEACINEYLWSLYERVPKVDVNKGRSKKKRRSRRMAKRAP